MASFDPSCIDVVHLLETIEVRNMSQATANEMRFSCPLPTHEGEDVSPSCYMNINTSAFFCHGCKARGTGVQFAGSVLGISPLEAIRFLKQAYQPGAINPDARDMVAEIKKLLATPDPFRQPRVPEEWAEKLAVDWEAAHHAYVKGKGFGPCDYMFERGFDPVTLNDWEFGYDEISGRTTFAARDIDGSLVGFKGRSVDGRHPKYLVLGDKAGRKPRYGFPCYQASRLIFGAHRIEPGSDIVICEGELNAIATTMKTGLPAVAINGSHFSDFHARIIRRIASSVTLFLDSDKAGKEAVWGWTDDKQEFHPGMVQKLRPYMDVMVAPDHQGDAASMLDHEIKACLGDSKSAFLVALQI